MNHSYLGHNLLCGRRIIRCPNHLFYFIWLCESWQERPSQETYICTIQRDVASVERCGLVTCRRSGTRREGGNYYLIGCLSEGILRIAAKTFEKSMREYTLEYIDKNGHWPVAAF